MIPNGPELIIILAVVLILFGPSKLPQLGKAVGKTMRSIREGMEPGSEEPAEEEPARTTAVEE